MKTKSIVLLTSLMASLSLPAEEAPRPNIVLILCDDLGYADVGFNGSEDITTPALDLLAKNGTIFTSAYVTHPFCGPSRMGLMSGRYPHAFGAPYNLPNSGQGIEEYNKEGIPVSETLISTVLQEAGYFTGAVGKWHMGIEPEYHPNKRGFDDYYGFLGGGHRYFPEQYQPIYERQLRAGNKHINDYFLPLEHNGKAVEAETEYLTDALSREAARFVKEASTNEQPFFLYLAYNAPHSPLEAKKEDLAKFASIKDEKRRTYAAMVYAVDRGVGKLVETLKSTGEFDNTLIVFLSDNGGKLGLGANNFPLREGKGSTCEGGYRVPMVFHWPASVAAGRRFGHSVSALDFYPTFAGLAGAKVPASQKLDGVDIWADLQAGRSPRKGGMVYALRHRNGFSDVGARKDQWKICRTFNKNWQLFNVEEDLGEKRDLSAQYPERVKEMVSEVEKWSRTHTEPQWFDSRKVAEGWRATGMPNYDKVFTIAQTDAVSPAVGMGDIIYSESFDADPGYVGAKGPNDNNISSVSFGIAGSSAPRVKVGEFAGTSQYLSGTAILGSTGKGKFSIGAHQAVQQKSRNRSYVTFIDTSAASVGQHNVAFDVSDFQSADANTALYLHVYEGSESHKGRLDLQVTYQAILPELAPNAPGITGKGAKIWSVRAENSITGNGRFSLNFGLREAGERGDFLALVWTQVKHRGSAPMPSMSIDNLVVSRLPGAEASRGAVPGAPLGQAGRWKLLDAVSDEFNSTDVDPRRWNSNPGSWGAWSWDEKNVNQEGGKLKLQLVHEPHTRNQTKLFYKSGILRSHQQMTYGYYEARIKGCSLFPGACPAFWTYSDGRQQSGEVRYCEIDIVELQMNELDHKTGERHPIEQIELNLHLRLADKDGAVKWLRPNSHPEICANSWNAPWDPRDDFHVYGCDVSPETITWYVDGKEVAKKKNSYWHLPMNVTLSLGLRHPHIGWVGQDMKPVPQAATEEGFPTIMEVDYVRVWARE